MLNRPRRSTQGGADRIGQRATCANFCLILGPMGDLGPTERTLRAGMDGAFFSPRLSKLRRPLRQHLGTDASPYLIDDGGGRRKQYRLALPA